MMVMGWFRKSAQFDGGVLVVLTCGGAGIDRMERQTELALVQKGIAQWQRTVDRLGAVVSPKAVGYSALTDTVRRLVAVIA